MRPTPAQIHRTQCELARAGRLGAAVGSSQAYYAACRELGRRGARSRASRRDPYHHLSMPARDYGRLQLPPRDRE